MEGLAPGKETILTMIGSGGLTVIIAVVIFLFSYKHSISLFDWIEQQTFGTRTYILEKLEFLHISIKEQHITYLLLLTSFGPGVIILVGFGLMTGWIVGVILSIAVTFAGFKIPRPFIDYFVKKRVKEYQGQMVDGLTLLSNGLRAGLSLPQSIGLVVDEMPAPINQEFNRILQENKIGVPLEECFEKLAQRVPLADNDMFVSSINILRETGGNLPEVFDTIVDVIRERVRLQQKIDTLTASGKMQGYTIAAMPFGLGGIFFVSDPQGMMPLFTHPIGLVMLLAALGLVAAGLFVILKIVKIEM